jgi:hypothetical protein
MRAPDTASGARLAASLLGHSAPHCRAVIFSWKAELEFQGATTIHPPATHALVLNA